MQTISLADLMAHLSEYIERAELEHEQFSITRDGRPAVVLVSAEEWESLQETLFWLSQPGIREDLAQADEDIAAGRVYDEASIRTALDVPPRG